MKLKLEHEARGIAWILLWTIAGCASRQSPPEGVRYGEEMTGATRVEISELKANPDLYVGKRVRVAGTIAEVCPRQGCWIDVAGANSEEIRVKVDDGVIVFPPSARGKRVEAEGTVRKSELSLDQSIAYMRHLAEERGEEFDPASVTAPLTVVRIAGIGALIEEEK